MNNLENENGQSTFFGELFKQLEPNDKKVGLRTKKTDRVFNDRDIFAGRDFLGNPHLLIPIPAGEDYDASMFTNYLGVEKRQLVHPNGEIHVFLDVFCLVNDVDALFAPICQEISDSLASIGNGPTATITSRVIQVIDRWREILKTLESKELSGNQITGLIGELLTLRSLAETQGENALHAWFGQDKTRHDFEFKDFAIEAKASTVLSRKACTIHGINQLSAAAGTTLKLVHFQIERSSSGLTIAKLIGEISPLVGGAANVQTKMSGIWPVFDTPPNWFAAWNFKVVSASVFAVNEDFPRIHSKTIPEKMMSQISDLQYSVNLGSLSPLSSSDGEGWRKGLEL
jgi:hypothetical protein